MSKEWFNKQEPKNEERRENIKKLREEIQMKNKKILTVAVDAGKGYTKCVYKKIDENGNVAKKFTENIELSSVVVGQEAKSGNTTYITIDGKENKYDFNGISKAVENSDKSKNNEEHRALMLRALFKIAQEEGITDFNVVMCISLDQYKVNKNIEDMKKTMSIGTFTIREIVRNKKTKEDEELSLDITIHNVVINPETLGGIRYIQKSNPKETATILVDIGTLNVGIVPIPEGRVDIDGITAPRIGYHHMIEKFKEYVDSEKSTEYPIKMLDYYVRKEQGSDKELDELLLGFFKNSYSLELKEEINKKGFGKFATLVFLGGTSIDCTKQIEDSFTEYKSVEVMKDIFATVKGAYIKGAKELEKIKKENN